MGDPKPHILCPAVHRRPTYSKLGDSTIYMQARVLCEETLCDAGDDARC